jgi:hypothetical protein
MSAPKKSSSKKSPAKKAPAHKSPAKKRPAKKAASKKFPSKSASLFKVAALMAPDHSTITLQGILAIDTDGIGDHHNDKTAQDQTSAKLDSNGKFVDASDPTGVRYLNADVDEYSVAPENLAASHGGPLNVGDRATVVLPNGITRSAPIGDFGPKGKAGEFSLIAVKNMGVQIIFTKSGPIPTLDGANASDIHVTVTFFPGTAS